MVRVKITKTDEGFKVHAKLWSDGTVTLLALLPGRRAAVVEALRWAKFCLRTIEDGTQCPEGYACKTCRGSREAWKDAVEELEKACNEA